MFRKKKILTLMETLAQAGICLNVAPGIILSGVLSEVGYLGERASGVFEIEVNNDFTNLLITRKKSPIISVYMDEAYSRNGSGYYGGLTDV